MKKYNITVNGVTYEVLVEETGSVVSAPVYTAPVAAPASNFAVLDDEDAELPF